MKIGDPYESILWYNFYVAVSYNLYQTLERVALRFCDGQNQGSSFLLESAKENMIIFCHLQSKVSCCSFNDLALAYFRMDFIEYTA